MSLSDRLKQVTNATAARDGDGAVAALKAIEAEHGSAAAAAVTAAVTADILAEAVRSTKKKQR